MKNSFTPEAVTLTVYGGDTSEYGVCWFTAEAGEPFAEFTDEEDVKFKRSVRISADAAEFCGSIRNTAVIKGLVPGKRYRWRVGDGSGVYSGGEVFTSLPGDAVRLSFTMYSDTQDRAHFGKWWVPAWRDAKKHYPGSMLTIHGGDIVDNGESHLLWERMTRHNRELFCSAPMLPVTGNHDHFAEKDGVMHGYFHLLPPEDKSEALMYYSLDAGPVHFTMLSSGDYAYTDRHGLKADQIEWAKRDIAGSNKKWKIVVIHTPFYSPGKYGSGKSNPHQPVCLREQLNEAFADLEVDLVLAGHDHIFSETYPITRDGKADRLTDYVIKRVKGEFYRLAVKPRGPIHVLPGCAGNQDRPIENEMDAETAGCFKDIVEIPKGCVSYVHFEAAGGILTSDLVIVNAESGERIMTRRFGICK